MDDNNIRANDKSYKEIVVYIKTKFKVTKLDFKKADKLLGIFFESAKINFFSYLKSNDIDFGEICFEYEIFEIQRTKDYEISFKDISLKENQLYIFIEKKTKYIYSYSGLLQNELFLYRGISQSDIDNETNKYKSYLFFLKSEKEYWNKI